MNTIEKTTGPMFRQRKHIKRFTSADAMHRFLNSQQTNDWTASKHDLKTGVYAYAGGRWLSVKDCDASLLAHI